MIITVEELTAISDDRSKPTHDGVLLLSAAQDDAAQPDGPQQAAAQSVAGAHQEAVRTHEASQKVH